jgi:hypothetical protein
MRLRISGATTATAVSSVEQYKVRLNIDGKSGSDARRGFCDDLFLGRHAMVAKRVDEGVVVGNTNRC